MSRTDKTRPLWVRIEDPYNRRHVVEHHDHRDGICNFEVKAIVRDWRERTCRLEDGSMFSYGEFAAKTCAKWCMCRWSPAREGRLRAAWRVMARRLIKAQVEDIEDIEDVTTNPRALRLGRNDHW